MVAQDELTAPPIPGQGQSEAPSLFFSLSSGVTLLLASSDAVDAADSRPLFRGAGRPEPSSIFFLPGLRRVARPLGPGTTEERCNVSCRRRRPSLFSLPVGVDGELFVLPVRQVRQRTRGSNPG